ncbi:MAG: hypothetical protein JWQ97_762 [Phenylobacterium sp.]|nr:hypothetical protein [Phenylobacterium sp.]
MLKRTDQAFELSPPAACSGEARRNIFAHHLVHVFPRFDVGGAQVRFVALVQALGHDYFHTVVSLADSYDAAALLAPGSPVNFVKPPDGACSTLQRLRRYGAHLRSLAPDLLLTYNWGAIEAALANVFAGAPHLHMEDGFGPDEATRQFARRVWTRRLALARSQIVVPSSTLQQIATAQWRLAPERVHHIPNGVAAKSDRTTDLDDLGLHLPAHRVRIAWAGALRPEKNPIRLLRAFAPLRDAATLILIGDGPERGAILHEAGRLGLGDSLRMVGRRNDSRDLIMQCDVLALSSDTEQMPLVVLEAMDAGLPVASVDVGDVRAMVSRENRPYITAVNTADLSRALALLVGGPATRRVVGEANRRRVRDIYTLPRMAAAYEDLIRRTLARGHAGVGAYA